MLQGLFSSRIRRIDLHRKPERKEIITSMLSSVKKTMKIKREELKTKERMHSKTTNIHF
jgi:hypothetical protein